jgi:hypothetical protein
VREGEAKVLVLVEVLAVDARDLGRDLAGEVEQCPT